MFVCGCCFWFLFTVVNGIVYASLCVSSSDQLRIGQDTDDSSSEEVQEDEGEHVIHKNEPVKEQQQEQKFQEETSDRLPDQISVKNESSIEEETKDMNISQLPAKSFQPSQGHCRKGSRRMTITRRATLHEHPRKLTSTEVRARCVQEILTTEKQYVQHLQDIIEVQSKEFEDHYVIILFGVYYYPFTSKCSQSPTATI